MNSAGIRIPHKYEVDTANERILKEYIDGSTIFELVRDNVPVDKYFDQVRIMAQNAKANGLNIDYFPTNLWFITIFSTTLTTSATAIRMNGILTTGA